MTKPKVQSRGHREKLVKAAYKLVLRKGLSATRVDEICREAGVTKGSFYHHFESKDDIASALLEDFFNKLAGALSEGGWTQVPAGRARLAALLDHSVEIAKGPLLRKGCIMGILTVDTAEVNHALRKDLGIRFNAVVDLVAPVFEAALKDSGVKPKAAKAESVSLSRQFVAVIEGGILLGKATSNPDEVADSVRCFRRMALSMIE